MSVEQSGTIRIQTTSERGGLLFITEKLPYIKSVALGFAYSMGSRDDPNGYEGTAHLIEHMIFKGTERLDAKTINILAESCGAELNGFTDKESTCFYARFPSEQKKSVIGLVGEILSAPAFREQELQKEKGVVAEEIRSNEEDPESVAVNLLFQAVYGENSMGKPTLGTMESITRLERTFLTDFYHKYYTSPNMVVVGVGDIEDEELNGLLPLCFAPPGSPVEAKPEGKYKRSAVMPPQVIVQTRQEISQSYVCLARLAFPYADPRRYALSVLNTILGGGVSSRLFQRLREDEGLVYSIGSFVELYQDSGLLGVYFVAESSKLNRCVAVLKDELSRLRKQQISPEEFNRALTMTRSAIVLSAESSINRMLRLARSYLSLKKVVSVDETVALYNKVSRDEVVALVDELLRDDRFYAGVVGPIKENEVKNLLE